MAPMFGALMLGVTKVHLSNRAFSSDPSVPPDFYLLRMCNNPPSQTQTLTITHKNITELIRKQFQFGNSATKITEDKRPIKHGKQPIKEGKHTI